MLIYLYGSMSLALSPRNLPLMSISLCILDYAALYRNLNVESGESFDFWNGLVGFNCTRGKRRIIWFLELMLVGFNKELSYALWFTFRPSHAWTVIVRKYLQNHFVLHVIAGVGKPTIICVYCTSRVVIPTIPTWQVLLSGHRHPYLNY